MKLSDIKQQVQDYFNNTSASEIVKHLEDEGMKFEDLEVTLICNCDKRDMPIYKEDDKNWCPQCGYEVL